MSFYNVLTSPFQIKGKKSVEKLHRDFVVVVVDVVFLQPGTIYTNLIFHLLIRAALSDSALKSHSGQDWLKSLNSIIAQFCWKITVHSCFPFSLLISWVPNTCIKWDINSSHLVFASPLQTHTSPILSLHPFDQAASLSRSLLPLTVIVTWLIPPSLSHAGAGRRIQAGDLGKLHARLRNYFLPFFLAVFLTNNWYKITAGKVNLTPPNLLLPGYVIKSEISHPATAVV